MYSLISKTVTAGHDQKIAVLLECLTGKEYWININMSHLFMVQNLLVIKATSYPEEPSVVASTWTTAIKH